MPGPGKPSAHACVCLYPPGRTVRSLTVDTLGKVGGVQRPDLLKDYRENTCSSFRHGGVLSSALGPGRGLIPRKKGGCHFLSTYRVPGPPCGLPQALSHLLLPASAEGDRGHTQLTDRQAEAQRGQVVA